MHRIN